MKLEFPIPPSSERLTVQNNYLSADDLVKTRARRYRDVEIEGSGKVRIRSLTERERSAFEAEITTIKGRVKQIARVKLLALCLVDSNGDALLTDDQVTRLLDQDSKLTGDIFNACLEHVGLTENDIEELEKNSEKIHVEAAPSA